MSNNTIQHHGIKGQKWGIQNGPSYPLSKEQRSLEEKKKTGSISESGKDRYGKDGVSSNTSSKSHEGIKNVNADKMADSTKASLIKDSSKMTDDELRSAINRMTNENTLKQMIAEQQASKPKELKNTKQILNIAKNSSSLISSGARLTGNKDLAEGMKGISKIIGEGTKSLDSVNNVRNKNYQREISSIKNKIDLSSMSDSELRSAINRISLEKSYNDLIYKANYVDSGKERVSDILESANATIGVASSAVGLAAAIKNMSFSNSNRQEKKNK